MTFDAWVIKEKEGEDAGSTRTAKKSVRPEAPPG